MKLVTPIRLIALTAASGLILAACTGEDASTDGKEGAGPEKFSYQTAIFEDITSDNYWSHSNNATVWTAYVLDSTRCSLFTQEAPSFSLIPDLATDDYAKFPAEENDDGTWSAEVTLQDTAKWSDGEPVTANDFAFTFNTVKDFGLTENWADWVPVEEGDKDIGVLSVEAVDDTTVRYTFNKKPGLVVWPFKVGGVPIMAEHHWSDAVEKASGTKDPSKTLTSESGKGDPSCGSMIYGDREKGAFAVAKANPNWHLDGTKVTHFEDGGAEVVNEKLGLSGVYGGTGEGKKAASYEMGPFLKDETFTIYKDQNTSVLALRQGETDFLFNSLGMERGLQEQVAGNPALGSITNPAYGMRYMAFNFKKQPMKDKAFRQALATIIDRQKMADEVLGGVAFPLFTAMPSGNEAWYDEAAAKEIIDKYDLGDEGARAEQAVKLLEDAGYTWAKKPEIGEDDTTGERVVVEEGEGIRMPNGQPMREVELQHPTPAYDPLRANYGVWVAKLADQIGIPIESRPTGFNQLVANTDTGEFDMYILGFSLGSPAMPDHYETFWKTGGDWNKTFYSNKEYDAIVERFLNAETTDEAKEIMWNELEPMVAEELPWIVLFDTPILEFYRDKSVSYPFTDTLSGLQYGDGFPSTVTAAQ